jgi:hypothetical protein
MCARHVLGYAHNLHHQRRSHRTAQSQASLRRGSPDDRGPGAGLASPNGGQALGTPQRASAAAQRDQIVCFASVAANCVIHKAFTVGACVEIFGRVPDTFELVFDADGVRRPYHVVWRKNENWSGVFITTIPTLRPPSRPVIAPLCTLALSRFAFSTRTDRSEPIATDSGPIRPMLRTARVTLKGPACFASSERPCALPPPRSRACARLGIPRQCSRADGCNWGGGITCSWSRRRTYRQSDRRNRPARRRRS